MNSLIWLFLLLQWSGRLITEGWLNILQAGVTLHNWHTGFLFLNLGSVLRDTFQIRLNDLRHLGNFWNLGFNFLKLGFFSWPSLYCRKLDIEGAFYSLEDSLVWQCDVELTNRQHPIFHCPGKHDLKILWCCPNESAFTLNLPIFKISLICPQCSLELARTGYLSIYERASVRVFIGEDMPTFDEEVWLEIAFLDWTINKLLQTLPFPDFYILLKHFPFIAWQATGLNFFFTWTL